MWTKGHSFKTKLTRSLKLISGEIIIKKKKITESDLVRKQKFEEEHKYLEETQRFGET